MHSAPWWRTRGTFTAVRVGARCCSVPCTIITFSFPAEHSEAFLLSSYRTTVEIVLVSSGQICKFIPNHCRPCTHASHLQKACCYAKQVSGLFWNALFAISLTAVGLWCTGLELPTASTACCLNEFYISILHPWDFPGKSTGVGCNCLLLASQYSCLEKPMGWGVWQADRKSVV